jgi:hypothetical protein
MNTTILPAEMDDLPFVFNLFEQAIQFQKEKGYIGWNSYDRDFITNDVANGLLLKVKHEDGVLGIFCICHTDKLIWREREKGDALYLHRVVLNREFEGARIFSTILNWSKVFAGNHNRRFIKMDTWAGNSKLIEYYKTYGFQFVENYTTADTIDLPIQHRNLNVALLELDLSDKYEFEQSYKNDFA